jgi:hypothetical protein
MTPRQKRQGIVIASSTVIGFLGDVIMYSLATSPKGKFKLQAPKGKALLQVLVIGFITGVIIDFVVEKIVYSQKPQHEKDIDKLVMTDLKLIDEGKLKVQTARKIDWIPLSATNNS